MAYHRPSELVLHPDILCEIVSYAAADKPELARLLKVSKAFYHLAGRHLYRELEYDYADYRAPALDSANALLAYTESITVHGHEKKHCGGVKALAVPECNKAAAEVVRRRSQCTERAELEAEEPRDRDDPKPSIASDFELQTTSAIASSSSFKRKVVTAVPALPLPRLHRLTLAMCPDPEPDKGSPCDGLDCGLTAGLRPTSLVLINCQESTSIPRHDMFSNVTDLSLDFGSHGSLVLSSWLPVTLVFQIRRVDISFTFQPLTDEKLRELEHDLLRLACCHIAKVLVMREDKAPFFHLTVKRETAWDGFNHGPHATDVLDRRGWWRVFESLLGIWENESALVVDKLRKRVRIEPLEPPMPPEIEEGPSDAMGEGQQEIEAGQHEAGDAGEGETDEAVHMTAEMPLDTGVAITAAA